MMHGREKSDSAIVAVKPTNKVVSATAEPVEPRAGAKGNASQQSTLRTQCRKCVSQALERIRQVRRHSPKVGAVCGNSARTDLGGGRSVMTVPTALRIELFRFWTQNGTRAKLVSGRDCSSRNQFYFQQNHAEMVQTSNLIDLRLEGDLDERCHFADDLFLQSASHFVRHHPCQFAAKLHAALLVFGVVSVAAEG